MGVRYRPRANSKKRLTIKSQDPNAEDSENPDGTKRYSKVDVCDAAQVIKCEAARLSLFGFLRFVNEQPPVLVGVKMVTCSALPSAHFLAKYWAKTAERFFLVILFYTNLPWYRTDNGRVVLEFFKNHHVVGW